MQAQSSAPTFHDIKQRVPIDAALAYYGATLKPRGNRLFATCPIHKGSNPTAFVVSGDRRKWYCFGDCSRGGTVIDLVAALESRSLREAAALLAERHGVT